MITLICNKQHLSNIWSSIHEKVKQHWGWVEKKRVVLEVTLKTRIATQKSWACHFVTLRQIYWKVFISTLVNFKHVLFLKQSDARNADIWLGQILLCVQTRIKRDKNLLRKMKKEKITILKLSDVAIFFLKHRFHCYYYLLLSSMSFWFFIVKLEQILHLVLVVLLLTLKSKCRLGNCRTYSMQLMAS